MDAPPALYQKLPAAEVDFLVEAFRSACMGGKAVFKPGDVRRIAWKQLHPDINWYYSYQRSQQIYKFKLSQPAYLITFDQKPGGYYYAKVCAVAGRGLPLMETWEKVLKTKFSHEDRRNLVTYSKHDYIEFPLPEEGTKISMRQLYGPFIALQVSAMSKAEVREWQASQAVKKSPLSKESSQ